MLTAGTFLMYEDTNGKYTFRDSGSSSTKWNILVDITEYPDLDSEAKSEDNTTLSCQQHTYEPGLPDNSGSMAFKCNYNDDDYERVSKLKDKILHMAVVFGGTPQADGVSIIPTGGKIVSEFNARTLYRRLSGGAGDRRTAEVDVYQTVDAKTYPVGA